MRIKKVSQYIEGGANLSNVYGTSDENGYTQEYINETLSGEVIWENEDTSQSFARQTITLPDTYKKVEIIWKRSTSSVNRFVSTIYNGYGDEIPYMSIGIVDNKIILRGAQFDNTSITFFESAIYNSYGFPTTSDNYMIPVKITGYK